MSAPATARSRWILSSAWDSALFIGAPLLCILTLVPLRNLWPSAGYPAFLLAFFTFGHHLPGFIRAYGDRELFRQYRWRFLLAPPSVFICALSFARADLHGLLLLVFTWDIWHVLMQHYGFMRIYDAKLGRTSPAAAVMDRSVSIAWYLTLIALSPYYTHNFLLRGYFSGMPSISPTLLSSVRVAMIGASALLAMAYAAHNILRWRSGEGPNWRKLGLLASFVSATWYLYIALDDFQVGFAVWSAFHCIQYYGIVWAFSSNRARKKNAVAAFMRMLFQPRAWLVAAYLGLIFAYGGINYIAQSLPSGAVQQLLMAFVVTSGTLHYYYDGFIWKVREPENRRLLDLDTTTQPGRRLRWNPGVVQMGYLAAALLALCILELRRPVDELSVRKRLALATPEVGDARLNLADALRRQGHWLEAAAAYGDAIRLMPASAEAKSNLGITLASLGRSQDAIAEFQRALILDPGLKSAHYNLASLLAREGNIGGALEHFRQAFRQGDEQALRALESDPNAAEALNNIGLGLLQSGDRSAGLQMLRRAVAANPNHAPARLNLASAMVMEGNIGESQGSLPGSHS